MHSRESLVTRWDLDKTYLRSRFDTLSDLRRTRAHPERQPAADAA
jgi:hypothetical protein